MVDIRDIPILFAAPLVRLSATDPAKREAPRQSTRGRRRRRRDDEQTTTASDGSHQLDEYI
jgi:hypothetical protein